MHVVQQMSAVSSFNLRVCSCVRVCVRVCDSQLAKNVGNAGFNEIMEACLNAENVVKPNPASDM